MAQATNTINVAAGFSGSNLQSLFNQVKKVFYSSKQIVQKGSGDSGAAGTGEVLISAGVEADFEFPVLEGGVTFNTGEAEISEINLTDGTVWTSKATKGDSDISFQVASVSNKVASTFLTKKTATTISTIKSALGSGTEITYTKGEGYALDVKKVTGSLVMFDQSGETMLILPNVEMYGSLVQDGDNPAYFNVKVTPKTNLDGVSIYIFNKK